MLIAIVDDIAEERVLLRTRLENILDQKNVEFHCYEYENGEAFLKASKEQDFTVLFLDIYMNGANGIEIAREFRKSNKDCLLIFTTTSPDHALDGFKVRAMHYLVKPYTAEELSSLIDEITQERSELSSSKEKAQISADSELYDRYQKVDELYGYLLDRLSVISQCWEVSLRFDNPKKHDSEILAPLKTDLKGGNSVSEAAFDKLYPEADPSK